MDSKRYRLDSQRETIRIVLAAMFIAMSFVLDIFMKFVPFLRMPNGGSISLTLLPLIIAALYLGPTYGFICGISFGLLNFLFDGGAGNIHWGSFFLDYTVAFGAVGFVGFFRPLFYKNKIWGFIVAVILAYALRYISSSLSGVLFFGAYAPEGINPWFYSFVLYNLAYIGPSLVLGLIVSLAIYRPIQKATHTSIISNIYRVKLVKTVENDA